MNKLICFLLNISYSGEKKYIYCVPILILKLSMQHEPAIRHIQHLSFEKPCLMEVSTCHHDMCQASTLNSANFH